MVVGPLKNSLQSALLVLIPCCLLFFVLSVWAMPSSVPYNKLYPQHILYNYIDFRLHAEWLIQLFNVLIVLAGALMVNFLAIRHEVTGKNNYLPAFLYALFAFSINTNAFVHPALLANLFVLVALHFYLETYRADHALSELFKAAFFMGLAPFFYTNYLLLLPFCFMMLTILRPFQWRDWALSLLAFSLPLYFFMGLSYLVGQDIWRIFSAFRETIGAFQLPVISEYYYPFLAMSLLLFILALAAYLGKGFGSRIKTQKARYVLLWMALLMGINIFGNDSDFVFITCSIPLSILVGDYLSELRQLKIANTLLFLLLAGYGIIYLHKLSII